MRTSICIRPMTIEDYDQVRSVWERTEGMRIDESDSRSSIERYLKRNPGFSQVAEAETKIVGAILFGHDGRRAHINHLAVLPEYRRRGIGRAIVQRCLEKIAEEGINYVYLGVFEINSDGIGFWKSLGWQPYNEVFSNVVLMCRKGGT